MYYYIDLIRRKERFGLIWNAAFDRADFNKFETKIIVRNWNTEKSCDDILKYMIEGRGSSPRMNSYVTATLMFGIVKVFREKVNMAFGDAVHIFTKWSETFSSFNIFQERESECISISGDIYLDDDEDNTNLHRHFLPRPNANLEEIVVDSQEKKKPRVSMYDSAVIDGDELIEILREADASTSSKTAFDHPDITMRERQVQEEIAPEQIFEEVVNIPDLLPEVQDILQGIEHSIEPATIPQLVPPTEVLDGGEIQLHPEDPSVSQMDVEPQLPTIVIDREEDVNPPTDTMADVADIDKVIQELIVPQDEVPPEEAERQIPKPKKNVVTSLSERHLKKREDNFHESLRCQVAEDDRQAFKETEKTEKVPDWRDDIPEILKPLEGLNPPRKWPPAQLEHLITIPMFDDKLQEETAGELMDVQTLRDGEEIDISMGRGSLGSPTPKTQPREAHKRSRASLSPFGLELRSFAEINATLEPIAEAATLPGVDIITSELLEVEEINVPLEEIPPVQPALPTDEPPLEEEVHLPSSPKRPRLELNIDNSSLTTPISYDDMLMSRLSDHLATKQETPTFHLLFPPSCTRKHTAARVFYSLLDLEKKKVIRTEQRAAFEDIFLFLGHSVDGNQM